jgi:hypothetical protein
METSFEEPELPHAPGRRMLCAAGKGRQLQVALLDLGSMEVVKTLAVPKRPQFVLVRPDGLAWASLRTLSVRQRSGPDASGPDGGAGRGAESSPKARWGVSFLDSADQVRIASQEC